MDMNQIINATMSFKRRQNQTNLHTSTITWDDACLKFLMHMPYGQIMVSGSRDRYVKVV